MILLLIGRRGGNSRVAVLQEQLTTVALPLAELLRQFDARKKRQERIAHLKDQMAAQRAIIERCDTNIAFISSSSAASNTTLNPAGYPQAQVLEPEFNDGLEIEEGQTVFEDSRFVFPTAAISPSSPPNYYYDEPNQAAAAAPSPDFLGDNWKIGGETSEQGQEEEAYDDEFSVPGELPLAASGMQATTTTNYSPIPPASPPTLLEPAPTADHAEAGSNKAKDQKNAPDKPALVSESKLIPENRVEQPPHVAAAIDAFDQDQDGSNWDSEAEALIGVFDS